jgi:hypothetical protein
MLNAHKIVMPAKAGTQMHDFSGEDGAPGSRFRGNDNENIHKAELDFPSLQADGIPPQKKTPQLPPNDASDSDAGSD